MEARARAKFIRIAPRKSRLVVDMIRGKNAAESAVILQFSTREASKAVLKVLNSAVANAVVKGASGADNLVVSEAFVDEGPILKRWRPRAQGRATRINKRTSHVTLVLNEIEEKEVKKAKEPAPAKAAKAPKTGTKAEIASSPKKRASRLPAGKAGKDGTTTKKAEPKAKKGEVAEGEIAASPKKRAPRLPAGKAGNDGTTTKQEPKGKTTETEVAENVSKEDTSGSEG